VSKLSNRNTEEEGEAEVEKARGEIGRGGGCMGCGNSSRG